MSCPDVIDLERFVLRELDRDATTSIEQHIASCQQCAREIEDMSENLKLAPALRKNDSDILQAIEPTQIGPYKILRKLGQGGMGTVYEAQQENPRRTVALKMIRSGLVSSSLLARFRHEAQVLGRLKHAGIAQVYEAGTFQTQPYFVMELVRGQALLDYANQKKLDLRRRLDLMARICDAVQHAHQQGVIHRDLKPDNILIDESAEGNPQPKILDFGVARVVDPEGKTTTLHTSVGQIVGTVAYMSPEQASGNPSEMDTRGDVYALGVICYELMSGRMPYRVSQASIAESVRAIMQDDPAPLATVNRSLRGDVTTIVGKALEKDKSRRYQSSAEMAADIRRYLRDEPIGAHPPSTIYQLRKFARRNKGLVAGVIATIMMLILGIITTSVQMVRAQHARVAADISANDARREAAKQKAVNAFLQDMIGSANPKNLSADDRAKGRGATVVDALNSASKKVDAGSLKDQPQIELAVRKSMGVAFEELGEYEPADHHLQTALELSRKLTGPQTSEVVDILNSLSLLRRAQGNIPEAEQYARQSLDLGSKVLDPDSPDLVPSMNSLALVLEDQKRLTEAEPLLRRALDIRMKTLGENNNETATALNNLGFFLDDSGRPADAEPLYRKCLEIRLKLLGDHPDTAVVMNNLGFVLRSQGKDAQAEPVFRDALAMRRKTLGPEHPAVATGMNNLGSVLQALGKLAEAEQLYKDALVIQQKVLGENHPQVAIVLNNIGGVLREQRKPAEAEPFFRQSLEMRKKVYGPDHPSVALCMNNLGSTLREVGKLDESEQLHRQAIAIAQKRPSISALDVADYHSQLGACLTLKGLYEEAERELLAAIKVLQPRIEKRDKRAANAVNYLEKLYRTWGKPEQAQAMQKLLPTTQRVGGTY